MKKSIVFKLALVAFALVFSVNASAGIIDGLLKPLLEQFKEEDNRSTNPNKVSYNRMLLISRIVYFFGYTDNPKFLDNDESISGIWTSYKDKEWTTVGANFR